VDAALQSVMFVTTSFVSFTWGGINDLIVLARSKPFKCGGLATGKRHIVDLPHNSPTLMLVHFHGLWVRTNKGRYFSLFLLLVKSNRRCFASIMLPEILFTWAIHTTTARTTIGLILVHGPCFRKHCNHPLSTEIMADAQRKSIDTSIGI
jgi:hypothetical protein